MAKLIGKLGSMRKEVDWILYLRDSSAMEGKYVIIQSDKRIAKVFLETGKAILSDGKGGHQGFLKLQKGNGNVVVQVPEKLIEDLKALLPKVSTGETSVKLTDLVLPS